MPEFTDMQKYTPCHVATCGGARDMREKVRVRVRPRDVFPDVCRFGAGAARFGIEEIRRKAGNVSAISGE